MYYVAGGNYQKGLNWEFNLVRPHGDEPCYITKNSNGLRLTSHHSSLYTVVETEKGYVLTRVQHRMLNSPRQISVLKYSALWDYLHRSIKYAEANNKFYE